MNNKIKIAGRKRIKDRGINWKEHYHIRSEKIKKRFDKYIGPMSYMRFEGHDYTTNSDYFVVVGPSLTKEGKKQFFAGIKKLPDDPKAKIFAPSGEYFYDLRGAFAYAFDRWGVPIPRNLPEYTIRDLAPVKIPRHIRGNAEELIKESQVGADVVEQYVADTPEEIREQMTAPELDDSLRNSLNTYILRLKTEVNTFSGQFRKLSRGEVVANLNAIIESAQIILQSVLDGERRARVTQQQAFQLDKDRFNMKNRSASEINKSKK